MTTPARRPAATARGAAPGERLGRVLQQTVLASALWVVGVSALCVPLSALGLWDPVIATVGVVAVAWQAWLLAARLPAPPVGRMTGALLVGIAVASTVWLGATHAEQVLPRRDAGSNVQAAVSLARTHHRVVPVPVASIGGPATLERPGVTLASPAFYQVGSAAEPAVQPQFVVGPAAVYSLAWWVGGLPGLLLVPALLTGLALLGLGLLVGRLVGARWGPVAALAAALVFPVVHTGRSTLSEPLADLTLVAAFTALALAAGPARDTVARRAGALAGLLVGGTALVRADALRETVLLTVVGALALVQRRAFARPLLTWAWASTAYALLAALWLSPRYLGDIAGSLLPLLAGAVVVSLGASVLVLAAHRGHRMPRPMARVLPGAAAALTVLVGLVLASRPLWQVVRQSPDDPGARVVAGMQLRQGLRVDGGRTYAEHSVAWLSWWTGWPALVVALLALALLLHRAARSWADGRDLPPWSGPLLVAAGSTVLTLYRPSITPDHPWADRRLLIALLLVVGLVAAAAGRVCGLLAAPPGAGGHAAGHRRWAGAAAGAVVAAALVVPSAAATWPHRSERVEQGSLRAVSDVCRALQPGDVALMVDSRAANEWPQVVRGQCGHAALSTTAALRQGPDLAATVRALAADIRAHGGRLVLLSADSDEALDRLGAQGIRQVSTVTVGEDERLLVRRPDHLVGLSLAVWLGRPAP